MRRVQLIEIHDQPWFPAFLRDAVTDDLQILLGIGKPYGDILPELREGIERSGADRVLDLCSGGGGPWPWLAEELKRSGVSVCVELSDKFPNEAARAAGAERFGAAALSRRAGGRGAACRASLADSGRFLLRFTIFRRSRRARFCATPWPSGEASASSRFRGGVR